MLRFQKQLSVVLIIAFAVSLTALAEEDDENEMFMSDNKVECVNKMVDWCDQMKYPKDGSSASMISFAMTDSSGVFWRIFCSSDSDGTNCTRNRDSWFSCSSDNKLNFGGVTLRKDSIDDVDDDICNTTKMAFNDILIQNLIYNSKNDTSEFSKGMVHFFKALAELEEELDRLKTRLPNFFPFGDAGFFNDFFKPGNQDTVPALPPPKEGSNNVNDREKE